MYPIASASIESVWGRMMIGIELVLKPGQRMCPALILLLCSTYLLVQERLSLPFVPLETSDIGADPDRCTPTTVRSLITAEAVLV